MVETYWSLSQAWRWILWRRVELAEAENGKAAQIALLNRGEKVGPIRVSTQYGRHLLIEALRDSIVTAFGKDGEPYPAETWKPLKLDAFLEGVRIVPDHGTHESKPGPRPSIPANPGIPSAAVMAAWPEAAERAAPTYWNLAETFHWIMWRNLKAVAAPNVGHASAITRREDVGLVMPPAEARESLLESLRGGDLAAIAGGASLTPATWASLRFNWLENGSGIVIAGDGDPAAPIPANPKFPVETVRTLWRDPAPAWQARAMARDDHTRHQFIIEHATTWHRNSAAPTLSVEMLAAELVLKAAAGAFEISLAATGVGGRGPDGLLLANLDVGSLRLTGIFTDVGALRFSDEITEWLKNKPASVAAHERLRLDRAFLDRWRDSDEGRAWALDRGLSVLALASVEPEIPPQQSAPHDWLAELRRWFLDELVPAHPRGLSNPDMEEAARKRFGPLSDEKRQDVRALRKASEAPDVWRRSGPKGRADKRRA